MFLTIKTLAREGAEVGLKGFLAPYHTPPPFLIHLFSSRFNVIEKGEWGRMTPKNFFILSLTENAIS